MPPACPSDQDIAGYLDGAIDPSQRSSMESHLDGCDDCRELVAALGKGAAAPAGGSERYEVIEQLGAGAMGAVYLARDTELDRDVALKILHPDAEVKNGTVTIPGDANAAAMVADRERLRDEARALAKLSHPNIVHVYDVGEVDGEVFVAMEVIRGTNLRAWLNDSERTWTEALAVMMDAGRGLAAAHSAGIVHRDFKPDNVLVGHDGRVAVTDFGLAKVASDDATANDAPDRSNPIATSLAGTPAYMAPELFGGTAAGAVSDQYSFCVALHEAVYGQRPGDDDAAVSAAPSWLDGVIRRGLSKRPDDRFASMTELLDAIERGRRGRRRVRVFGGVGLLAVVAIGGAVWIGMEAGRAEQSPSTAAATVDAAASDARPPVSVTTARLEIKTAMRERKAKQYRSALARLDKLAPRLEGATDDQRKRLLAWLLRVRCRVWAKLANYNAAGDDCLRSSELYAATYGPEHAKAVTVLVRAGIHLVGAHNFKKAEPVVKRALEMSKKHTPDNVNNIFIMMSRLGKIYNRTGRPGLAEPLVKDALRYYTTQKLKQPILLVAAYQRLANSQWEQGKKAEALATIRRGIELSKDPKVPESLTNEMRKWIRARTED